jgi:hypothetical protein
MIPSAKIRHRLEVSKMLNDAKSGTWHERSRQYKLDFSHNPEIGKKSGYW